MFMLAQLLGGAAAVAVVALLYPRFDRGDRRQRGQAVTDAQRC
jgi:hypothetical protein